MGVLLLKQMLELLFLVYLHHTKTDSLEAYQNEYSDYLISGHGRETNGSSFTPDGDFEH